MASEDKMASENKTDGQETEAKPALPLPQNWPAHIPYLRTPMYSPDLTMTHIGRLRTRPSDLSDPLPEIPRSLKSGPCPAVCIVPIRDPNHPANGQYGLFATRDLRPGSLILPYLGELHVGTASGAGDKDGYDYAKSDYDLWMDRDADVAVDAARAGNEARFVNDYRGVPGRDKKPNAEFKVVWDPRIGGGAGEKCMAVYVLPAGKRAVGRARTVGIARGEEVLVNYGKGFWQERRRGGAGNDRDDGW